MSCVAPLIAINPSKAIEYVKYSLSGNDNAMRAKQMPVKNCVVSTKNFLVLYISRNGLQSGLSVHGKMIMEVQKAMSVSETPIFLNMIPDVALTAQNGNPIAKYNVGIQSIGWGSLVFSFDMYLLFSLYLRDCFEFILLLAFFTTLALKIS